MYNTATHKNESANRRYEWEGNVLTLIGCRFRHDTTCTLCNNGAIKSLVPHVTRRPIDRKAPSTHPCRTLPIVPSTLQPLAEDIAGSEQRTTGCGFCRDGVCGVEAVVEQSDAVQRA